jgi:signal transduction histidine kinase/ligand-binding sensor domain-containing protein
MQHTVVSPGGEPVGAVLVLAQDADGFLWMTTFKGQLLRFDGQSLTAPYSTQLKPFDDPVTILLGPNGESRDMWIGHRRHGLTHLVDGVATHYDGAPIPPGSVHILRRDRNGVVWAVTPEGVARFADGHWQAVPASFSWDEPHPDLLTVDETNGDVFVLDAKHGPMVSRHGNTPFTAVALSEIFRTEAGMAPGTTWPLSVEIDATMRAAGDGALWLAPLTGIERYRWSGTEHTGVPDIKERMTFADGLSSTWAYDILEDHEGDVWLATTRGLDRFRKPHATPLVFPEPVEFPAIATTADGSLWITTTTQAPLRVANGKMERMDVIGDGVSAIEPLPDGSVLFAGKGGLRRWQDGKVAFLPVPKALEPAGIRFRQVLAANDGTLWVIAATYGLYRVEGAHWRRMNGQDGLPEDTPSFVRRLADGSVGLAYPDAGLFAVAGHTVRRVLLPEAGAGAPTDWLSEADGMWVGGSKGLVYVGRDGAHAVNRPDGRPFVAVSGMVRDTDDALWVFHQDGVDRVSKDAAAGVARDEPIPATLHLDAGEGIGENAAGIIPVSSLTQDARGNLWLAGNTVVSSINPQHVAINNVRPKVFVDALVSDQKAQLAIDGATVPALTHTVRIDYTAPMLRRPGRTRFEYRLNGVDDEWQQAGNRRSAYYTKLAPGSYTFRVRAYNEDGVQSAQDAVYRFRVAPMWYQSMIFAVLSFATLLAVVWAAYVFRVRVITRRLRIRTDERERIARDLHDTLLQGFQGLVLRFEAIRSHAGTDRARDMIDRALVRADDVLVEGREKVAALRRSDADNAVPGDFGRALENIGDERPDLHPATYRVVVRGNPRALRSDVYENLHAITREAVLNALQHAGASVVTAEVSFSRRTLAIRVVDNGKGFDVRHGKEGHWGLLGMRERALVVGADLDIRSVPGSGVEVTLRITASRAYL